MSHVSATDPNDAPLTPDESNTHADATTTTPSALSSRDARLLPETRMARTYRPTIEMNFEVAKAINNHITALHIPNNLRRVAKNRYLQLSETKLFDPPRTELETDAHIAAFSLHEYGAVFQVLSDLKKRIIGSSGKFQPQRVLDVGIGPAMGMVAFNDVMGPEYRCQVKDAVIVSGHEMQKRAKIILSRQYNEVPEPDLQTQSSMTKIEGDKNRVGETVGSVDTSVSRREGPNAEEQEEGAEEGPETESGDNDLVGAVMTKKIKLVTKLRDTLPTNKEYDLIIVSHQLLTKTKNFPTEIDENLDQYMRLLAPGGHIVFIERGTPLGFETIARVRQVLLRPERYPDEVGKIPRPWKPHEYTTQSNDNDNAEPVSNYYLKVIAPCPHHGKCPMQVGNPDFYELKGGKKLKFCSYQKAIKRPKFSMELKKGKLLAMKWEDEVEAQAETVAERRSIRKKHKKLAGSGRPDGNDFEVFGYSYLVVERTPTDLETLRGIQELRNKNEELKSQYQVGSLGDNTPDTWPRIVNQPKKNKGHVILNLCASSGNLENWIIPKSFDKRIYHDARKAYKGDQWGLDAKTKLLNRSEVNLGTFEALNQKRIKELKQKEREEAKEMSRRFSELKDRKDLNPEEMKELARAYGYFYDNQNT